MNNKLYVWLRQISKHWIMASVVVISVSIGTLLSVNTLVYNALFGPFEITEEEIIELSNQQLLQDTYAPFLEFQNQIYTKNVFKVMKESYHKEKRFYFKIPTKALPYDVTSYDSRKFWEFREGGFYEKLPGEDSYHPVDYDDDIDQRFLPIIKNMGSVVKIQDKVLLGTTKSYLAGEKGGFFVPVGEKLIGFAERYMETNNIYYDVLSSDILRIAIYDNGRFNTIFFGSIKILTILFVILIVLAIVNIIRYSIGYKNYKKHPCLKKKYILDIQEKVLSEGVDVNSKLMETKNWRIYKNFWTIKFIKKSKYLE